MGKDNVSSNSFAIYLHWPFCLSKCPYCDFLSLPITACNGKICESKCRPYLMEDFEDLLLQDLQYSSEEFSARAVSSVFFGGGTPSLMSIRGIEKILNFISKNFAPASPNIEISLEANPATFSEQKLIDIKIAGVNRLSLGVQSFIDDELRFLGRIYDSAQTLKSAEIVARNFDNFSFDFIYGFEKQSLENLERSLSLAIDFDAKHISCYQLTFEENTPFFDWLKNGRIKNIGEKAEIKYYKFIEKFLAARGIKKYEISNFAAPGFQCKHNLTYWNYGDYLGIGPSAHGRMTIDGKKHEMQKIRDPFEWAKNLQEFNRDKAAAKNQLWKISQPLSEEEVLKESLIVGLRLVDGIEREDLARYVSRNTIENFLSPSKLNFLRTRRLLRKDKLRLTKFGMTKINAILEFLFLMRVE